MNTWISPPPPWPVAIRPPLTERWKTDAGIGYMDQTPVSDGDVVVVVSLGKLVGLSLADGRALWRRELSTPVSSLIATPLGPVVVHGKGESLIVALSWSGDVRWERAADLDLGGDALRGLGETFLAKGVSRGARGAPLCRLFRAATGEPLQDFHFFGDLPHAVPRGLAYSVRASDPAMAGTFLYDVERNAVVRLVEQSSSIRAVSEAVVVIDTWDFDVTSSRLIATDSTTERRLWEAEGGPSLLLGIDATCVASVTARGSGTVVPTLRELQTGRVLWESAALAGRDAKVLLAADAVLVEVDGERLHVLERRTGQALQSVDGPFTAMGLACPTKAGLVALRSKAVVCLSGQGS